MPQNWTLEIANGNVPDFPALSVMIYSMTYFLEDGVMDWFLSS